MKCLQVVNWDRFQHYKDRRPPWIKLYVSLLDNPAWTCLQDDSRLLLVCLWLLASKHDGAIPWNSPGDRRWAAEAMHLPRPLHLNPLLRAGFVQIVEVDSIVIASCKQSAMLETETETETETERERERARKRPRALPSPLIPD